MDTFGKQGGTEQLLSTAEEATEKSPLLVPNFHSTNQTVSSMSFIKWTKTTKIAVLVLAIGLIVGAGLVAALIISGNSEQSSKLKAPSENDEAVVEIPQGKLKWVTLQSRENRSYYAFFKIPYAKPPIGQLRFEAPQPPDSWTGTRFIKEVAPQCLQRSKYSPIVEAVGSEDCLYINIYSPKLPGIDIPSNETLLPTLLYIHGGGFSDGNGSRYGADYFMDEDCVLITFQYRLGVFGFLSSEDGVIKGNMAFRDQIRALQWTRENVKYFGGNPDNIMIFGNSAGAVSVNHIMVSPMGAGLYHSAITQSGPGLGPLTASKEAHIKSFEALASEAGCWSKSRFRRSNRVMECLKGKNASDLAVIRGTDIIFASTVEDYESQDEIEKFLPDRILNSFRNGKVNKVPWMLGVLNAEWVAASAFVLTDLDLVDNLNSNWVNFAPSLFQVPYSNSPIRDEISNKARDFYFGNKLVGNDTIWNLTNMSGDHDFVHTTKTQGMLMAELGVEVFFYYLSKRPAKSYSDGALIGFPAQDYGASHADELQYLFNYYGYPEYYEGPYYTFSKYLVSVWVQFAKTKNPGWVPAIPNQNPISYYEFNDQSGPTTVLQDRIEFWDQFTVEELCYS